MLKRTSIIARLLLLPSTFNVAAKGGVMRMREGLWVEPKALATV